MSASDSILINFGATWAILVNFGEPSKSRGCQKRHKKLNTATFWHPKAIGRRKKVVLEGARKINRNFDRILVGKRRPRKAKIMKKVFVLKHLHTLATFE